jgi:hypothetical protein
MTITDAIHAAVLSVPASAWTPAVEPGSEIRQSVGEKAAMIACGVVVAMLSGPELGTYLVGRWSGDTWESFSLAHRAGHPVGSGQRGRASSAMVCGMLQAVAVRGGSSSADRWSFSGKVHGAPRPVPKERHGFYQSACSAGSPLRQLP